MLKVTHESMSSGCILTQNKLFNDIYVLAGAGRAFSAAPSLPLYGTRCVNLSTAVSPSLNVTTACQEINSIFSTITLILSQNFYQNIVLISENHPHFPSHQKM